jgi:coenzyme PQQ synthesis protein D (PqqD)
VTGRRVTRNGDVVMREVDDATFLVGPRDDGVFYLNTTGAAVWRLLAEPLDVDEMVGILTGAFPDAPVGQVRDDVAKLIEDLDGRGFLRWVD